MAAIIFDGDDTLWETERLYDEARSSVAEIVGSAGLNPQAWDSTERVLDVQNVKIFGLSSERFPTSCADAYVQLADSVGARVDPTVVAAIRKSAASVFERQAPVVSDAQTTLEALKPLHRLVLLTQGDKAVQNKRIAESGLEDLFEVIEIVDKKGPKVLEHLLGRLEVFPSETWMVGNSVPSDINPALAVGMNAIWVDAHVWEHERREQVVGSDLVHPVGKLADVPALIGK